MMKITALQPLLLFLSLSLAFYNCSDTPSGGTTISGTIDQASELQVFLDKLKGPGAAAEPIAKTTSNASGTFKLVVEQPLSQGAYRLRIGARKLPLIIDGNESAVEVSGSLDGLQRYQYGVTGSASSHSLQNLLGALAQRQYSSTDVTSYIDTVANPYGAVYAAEVALGPNGKYLEALKKAQQRLESASSGSDYGTKFGTFVNQTAAVYAQQMATELIKVGQPAPDITLPDPDGKEYSLSDLKGKIVLLDFWASWCGPCRRENPNVVRVYDQYKDQGFTVFSVSLDGLDSRSKARMQGEEQIAKGMEAQKNRWVSAIAQDNLKWPYHVSDLQKWESLPARAYGVSSIPRTFLIDRDGTIAAINPRGVLEQELKKLL